MAGDRDRSSEPAADLPGGAMPSPDPRPGRNPGYDESNPRTAREATLPLPGTHTGAQPNPEAGGLEREQGDDPDPARSTTPTDR